MGINSWSPKSSHNYSNTQLCVCVCRGDLVLHNTTQHDSEEEMQKLLIWPRLQTQALGPQWWAAQVSSKTPASPPHHTPSPHTPLITSHGNTGKTTPPTTPPCSKIFASFERLPSHYGIDEAVQYMDM